MQKPGLLLYLSGELVVKHLLDCHCPGTQEVPREPAWECGQRQKGWNGRPLSHNETWAARLLPVSQNNSNQPFLSTEHVCAQFYAEASQ